MPEPRMIELLAPAKELACGIAAVDHGADAVYIGAERFGARAAAGNSVADIAALCEYAHLFRAKVYVTVNTIIYDEELLETKDLLRRLAEVGVDAILVQDMAVLEMARKWSEEGVPMPQMHASTQTDNRNAAQVAWLAQQGFSRVVLARELSVRDIRQIHQEVPDVELEAFVHGALCVSYSGACYASQYCFQRSANRGECAQFCRLKFSLVDADGKVVMLDKYFLSLKDMCRIDHLYELLEAGVTSFKIEGRLKDVDYVKNVVAAYSQQIDDIIRKNPDKYKRASLGKCEYSFEPNLRKSFNRGFTEYFLHGGKADIAAMDSPKAIGEPVGVVKALGDRWLTVAGSTSFNNGDGLCFFDNKRQLVGFRLNKVENNKLFPLKMPKDINKGTTLYRNFDKYFVQMLSQQRTAIRRMETQWTMNYVGEQLSLDMMLTETGEKVSVRRQIMLQKADKQQHEMMVKQLTKLGNTPFVADNINLDNVMHLFIPSSVLADMRRKACEEMRTLLSSPLASHPSPHTSHPLPLTPHPPIKNVSNELARDFYLKQGASQISDAIEVKNTLSRPTCIMECKHCLRFALGHCIRRGQPSPNWREPLALVLPDKRRFTLDFDCKNCQMNVYAE
ncbi:MAG: U32 family peptidase [Prevotella sp.]|nr:U32 family peptidase [Prevotella sp.]